MDRPGGASAEPGGGVPPPAAFYGLWPRLAEHVPDGEPRRVTVVPARTAHNGGEMDRAARPALIR
ncbi:MAG TPA: hypothetical protein VFJ16_17575 [Longimicrobium sp.]|nr:hypothetical protein [Longimicrobium sp.]